MDLNQAWDLVICRLVLEHFERERKTVHGIYVTDGLSERLEIAGFQVTSVNILPIRITACRRMRRFFLQKG